MLNMALAASQNLADETVASLKALHYAMAALVEHQNADDRHLTPTGIDVLRVRVRDLEFLMQDLWGFARDETKHTHWRRFNVLKVKKKAKVKRSELRKQIKSLETTNDALKMRIVHLERTQIPYILRD